GSGEKMSLHSCAVSCAVQRRAAMANGLYRSMAFGFVLCLPTLCLAAPGAEFATTKEGIVGTYRKTVPEEDFATIKSRDEKNKPRVMERQKSLLTERYDLSDRASSTMMSGGRKAVQQGVRVRLPAGSSWDKLAAMSPDQIRDKGLFP